MDFLEHFKTGSLRRRKTIFDVADALAKNLSVNRDDNSTETVELRHVD
jgi:hypothetical protein